MSPIYAALPGPRHWIFLLALGGLASGISRVLHGEILLLVSFAIGGVAATAFPWGQKEALGWFAPRLLVIVSSWAVAVALSKSTPLPQAGLLLAASAIVSFVATQVWSLFFDGETTQKMGEKPYHGSCWTAVMIVAGALAAIYAELCTTGLGLTRETSLVVMVGYTLGMFRIAISCRNTPAPLYWLCVISVSACGLAFGGLLSMQIGDSGALSVAALILLSLRRWTRYEAFQQTAVTE